jgi:hypothetical protein
MDTTRSSCLSAISTSDLMIVIHATLVTVVSNLRMWQIQMISHLPCGLSLYGTNSSRLLFTNTNEHSSVMPRSQLNEYLMKWRIYWNEIYFRRLCLLIIDVMVIMWCVMFMTKKVQGIRSWLMSAYVRWVLKYHSIDKNEHNGLDWLLDWLYIEGLVSSLDWIQIWEYIEEGSTQSLRV